MVSPSDLEHALYICSQNKETSISLLLHLMPFPAAELFYPTDYFSSCMGRGVQIEGRNGLEQKIELEGHPVNTGICPKFIAQRSYILKPKWGGAGRTSLPMIQ